MRKRLTTFPVTPCLETDAVVRSCKIQAPKRDARDKSSLIDDSELMSIKDYLTLNTMSRTWKISLHASTHNVRRSIFASPSTQNPHHKQARCETMDGGCTTRLRFCCCVVAVMPSLARDSFRILLSDILLCFASLVCCLS